MPDDTPGHGARWQVLDFLGRCVFRIAITNSRLERIDNGQVTFRYRDNRSQNLLTTPPATASEPSARGSGSTTILSRLTRHRNPRFVRRLGVNTPCLDTALSRVSSLT
ncbi:MAG: transposase [Acidobacteriota bacterium]